MPDSGKKIDQVAHASESSYAILAGRDVFLGPPPRHDPPGHGAADDDDPDSLARRAAEARAIGMAGNPGLARELYGRMLPAYQRVMGHDHLATLDIMARLGYWADHVGDFRTSRLLYEELYGKRVRVQGEGHQDTLDTLGDLAEATGYAGDPASACRHYERLVGVRASVLGWTHDETHYTMGRLAEWLGATGRAEHARDMFAGLLGSLPPTPANQRTSQFAHESLVHWRERVKYERKFQHKDMRGWSEDARRRWRDGIS
ncbi:hypothetical protein ADK67_00985 [Saccharothrix sp. NRRL B-16348]|uniref:tetratricopeptide repeat protein n=1 Tax=Saccharothrix sp. NRRL B-16348 TaxID=1415542 RepID=UPI0006AEDB44|nr:tetratricopeptide repeat protein [Saccharothrix sp. NRRL B-16348]KOX35106.1 hypothetical protein ADK67_00985 [Saccharothrix sp. NRRL B-16348]